jgi:hypothetical protein
MMLFKEQGFFVDLFSPCGAGSKHALHRINGLTGCRLGSPAKAQGAIEIADGQNGRKEVLELWFPPLGWHISAIDGQDLGRFSVVSSDHRVTGAEVNSVRQLLLRGG